MRKPLYEKTDVPHLLKDRRTSVVINTNIGEYQKIKAARAKARANRNEMLEVRTELRELRDTFRNDMQEILHMLRKING